MFCYRMASEGNHDSIPVRAVRRWPGPVCRRLAGSGGGGFRGKICWSRGASESADGRGLDRLVLPVDGLLVVRVAATDAGRRGPGGPAPGGLAARGAAGP